MFFLNTSLTSDGAVNPSLLSMSATRGCHFSTSSFALSAHSFNSGTSETSTVTRTVFGFSSPQVRAGRAAHSTAAAKNRTIGLVRMTPPRVDGDRRPGLSAPLRRGAEIDFGFMEERGRLLRRHGINVETGAPLEA